jgi:glycosyltransferase involved in cell wall biosynthesis
VAVSAWDGAELRRDAPGLAATPRILFLCHNLRPLGGGEAVAAWMLQALATAYDVAILTWEPPDFTALDRKFGTSLAGRPFEVRTPPRLASRLVSLIPDDSLHQRANYLVRLAKQQRREFAAVVACTFESEVGEPAICYIHYPYLARKSSIWTVAGDAPPVARLRGLLAGRTRPWMLVSGYSFARLQSNLTLTNSQWTRGEIARLSGMASEVLYPPAAGDFIDTPWDERRDAFASMGRLVSIKRQDLLIETLALVRREWPRLELHICGSGAPSPYLRRVEELAARHGPWVHIHRDLPRKDWIGLLSRCRYGIHACIDEHFGMAPAEMARAGCIPFVHASGGQVEIAEGDERLCFTTAADAVAKILAVMRDAGLQQALRSEVYRGSERFAPAAFIRGFLGYVRDFLEARGE